MLEDLQVRRRNNVVDRATIIQQDEFREEDSSIIDYYGAKYGSAVQDPNSKEESKQGQDVDYLQRYTSIHENAFKQDLQKGGNIDEDDIDPNENFGGFLSDLQNHMFGEDENGEQVHRRSERTGVMTDNTDFVIDKFNEQLDKPKEDPSETARATFKKDQDAGPSEKPQMMVVDEDGEEVDQVGELPESAPEKTQDSVRRRNQSAMVGNTADMRGIPYED
jgi:hypothetical protein